MSVRQLCLLVLLSFFNSLSNANTYYVAPDGNDSTAGTIGAPWGTWQKAFDKANAGDTVFFRGGVWYPATTTFQSSICLIDPTGAYQASNPRGHSGSKENPICFFNYPGETPVLDCRNVTAPGNYLDGISLYDQTHYLHFKGLEIRNVWQKKHGVTVNGIATTISSNLTFENISVHNLSGRGLWISSTVGYGGITSDTTRIVNCDFYNCADTLQDHPFNMADGIKGDIESGGVIILDGVRIWNCSDDGVDLSGSGQKILKNCWAFNMGTSYTAIYVPDDGNGFKLGGVRDSISYPNWIMSNCISAGNLRFAVHMLDYSPYYKNNARVYNCVFYKNEEGPWGFQNAERPFHNTEFYNCISYKNTNREVGIFNSRYPESNNSWEWADGPSIPYKMSDKVTVTDDDFVSLDIGELSRPRKADGSLPDVGFMKLAAGSDLIDAGTTTTLSGKVIGIPFYGSAPDIGVFEFNNAAAVSTSSIKNLESSVTLGFAGKTAIVQFSSLSRGVYQLAIYSLTGRKIFETRPARMAQGLNSIPIDASKFSRGFYLCHLMCNEKTISTINFVKK